MTTLSITKFYNQAWQNWNEFVRYYPASIHRRRFIANEIKKIKNWSSLADFGCGNAILIYSLYYKYRAAGKYFFGLDVSSEQIEKNKEMLPDIDFEELDFTERPAKQKFDVITCSEVIEHIPNYEVAIKNIVDSLNPGGTVIITVPKDEIFYTEQTFGHLRHFLRQDIREAFEKHGIITKKCTAWGFPFHDLAKYFANLNPRGVLSKFASGKLPWTSKVIFGIVNFFYHLNFLPLGKQLYYVGEKPAQD